MTARIPDEDVIGFLLGAAGIACGTIVILAAIVARCWTRSQQRQVAAPLIREMLERGMSGEEIAGVLTAAFDSRPRRIRQLRKMLEPAGQRREQAASAR
jgi:hypothetical protein